MPLQMPETRYARSGDVSIAYQVIGDGPFDVVHVPGFVSHVELEDVVREDARAALVVLSPDPLRDELAIGLPGPPHG